MDLSLKTAGIGPQLPPGFGVNRSETNDTEDQQIGPSIPPKFKQTSEDESDEGDDSYGPSIPLNLKPVCGPVLPPGFGTERLQKQDIDDKRIGPALPPNFKRSSKDNSGDGKDHYGPRLPPTLKTSTSSTNDRNIIGPVLPIDLTANFDDSEEEDIGPKLHEAADAKTQNECSAASDFERRAEKMKNMLLSKDTEVTKREAWMTELPSRLGPQIGIEPRTFKKHSYSGKDNDDRSEWTDTPADRKRKAEMQIDPNQGPSASDVALDKRNKDIADSLQNYNKSKRKESLLDIHQKKRKSSQKDKGKVERREFDRDKDLNIQNVDAAQAKNFIDKARLFNTKFSHGASHFL